MRKLPFKSLTLRIWTTFIIFVVVIISALSFIYLVLIRNMDKANQLQNIQVGHDTLLQIMSQSNGFSPSAPPKFDLDQKRPISHIIVKAKDEVILNIVPLDRRFVRDPNSLIPLASWFIHNLDKDASPFVKSTYSNYFEGTEYVFVISTIADENHVPTYLISYLSLEQHGDYFYIFLLIGLVFIVIALIVSKIISAYISKPLRQLEKQTLKIAHKEWIEPMVPTSNDEIGSLINSINFMQNSLKQADQDERKFLQSISHDLKTPIMVILSHAEAIKDGIYIDSLENTAEIIKSEALRLENKVKQILYYNTLDYALINDQTIEEIDLGKFVNYIIKRLETIRPELEWKLCLKSILVYTNSERLLVALENILDNQMRYAKSYIRIVVRRDENSAIINISNDGPHIPSGQLPHIFKNLYRGENGKFGLGLAITHKIITFYGGNITVENTNIGVLFRVRLPITPILPND